MPVSLWRMVRSFARRYSGPWSPHSQKAEWLSLPLQSETEGLSRRGCFEPSIPASGFVFAKVEHSELQSWITTASFQALDPGPCIVTTCLSPQSTPWKRSMHFHSTITTHSLAAFPWVLSSPAACSFLALLVKVPLTSLYPQDTRIDLLAKLHIYTKAAPCPPMKTVHPSPRVLCLPVLALTHLLCFCPQPCQIGST